MIRALLSLFGICTHRSQTRVWTIKGRTYTVCLDCGHEAIYDWTKMRSSDRREPVPERATEVARG